MENNTQKTALSASLKAEENKLMVKLPEGTGNPASVAANEVTKSSKKTATPKNKSHKKERFAKAANEFVMLDELKAKCRGGGFSVSKQNLLRAGVLALMLMPQADLMDLLSKLDKHPSDVA